MNRPDYCPIGGEPCQSLCDTPCGSVPVALDGAKAVERVKAKLAADPAFARSLLPNLTHAEAKAMLQHVLGG